MTRTAPPSAPPPPTGPADPARTDDDVPRPRTAREWRDTLDDDRLPAGPDGWWSTAHPG